MSTNPKPQPQSDEDWIIHSINIHGYFFERWCRQQINSVEGWSINSYNYPVGFPYPGNTVDNAKESNLDIRAQFLHEDRFFTLPIECKKNNPDFVNWVFFPKIKNWEKNLRAPNVAILGEVLRATMSDKKVFELKLVFKQANYFGVIVEEAREVRGTYSGVRDGDKTKTSNAAISNAAYQVALATQALIAQEKHYGNELEKISSSTKPTHKMQVFLPVIVTTANLFICDFKDSDIDPATGEIAFDKASLHPCDSVIYEYPIPSSLQGVPESLTTELERPKNFEQYFMRMHILVINSLAFEKELQRLSGIV